MTRFGSICTGNGTSCIFGVRTKVAFICLMSSDM